MTVNPPVLSNNRPVTAEDLTYILFGNRVDPQDKGIIGRMQDQQHQMLLWFRLSFFTFLAALLTSFSDLLLHLLK